MLEPREPLSRTAAIASASSSSTPAVRAPQGRSHGPGPTAVAEASRSAPDASGEVVSREDIQRALWGRDTFVDFEQGVNHAIRELRAVLGDSAESPRFIRTFARRGYGFIAPVEGPAAGQVLPAAAPAAPSIPPAPAGSTPRRRQAIVAGLAVFAIAGAILVALAPWSRDASEGLRPTIAVVPFTAADTDPALGAGLASAIVARLGVQQRAFVRLAPASRSWQPRRGHSRRCDVGALGRGPSSG